MVHHAECLCTWETVTGIDQSFGVTDMSEDGERQFCDRRRSTSFLDPPNSVPGLCSQCDLRASSECQSFKLAAAPVSPAGEESCVGIQFCCSCPNAT